MMINKRGNTEADDGQKRQLKTMWYRESFTVCLLYTFETNRENYIIYVKEICNT